MARWARHWLGLPIQGRSNCHTINIYIFEFIQKTFFARSTSPLPSTNSGRVSQIGSATLSEFIVKKIPQDSLSPSPDPRFTRLDKNAKIHALCSFQRYWTNLIDSLHSRVSQGKIVFSVKRPGTVSYLLKISSEGGGHWWNDAPPATQNRLKKWNEWWHVCVKKSWIDTFYW